MRVDPADRACVVAHVRACGAGVIATVDAAGHPEAALVGLAVLDDGRLVLDAPQGSRKVVNLVRDPRVAVVVGWEDDLTLQLEGLARVVTGSERLELATAYVEQHPGSRVLDDGLAVVVIAPSWVRSYDARPVPALVVEARWA